MCDMPRGLPDSGSTESPVDKRALVGYSYVPDRLFDAINIQPYLPMFDAQVDDNEETAFVGSRCQGEVPVLPAQPLPWLSQPHLVFAERENTFTDLSTVTWMSDA